MKSGLILINDETNKERKAFMKRMYSFVLISAIILLSACTMPAMKMTTTPPDSSNPIYTVALLPVYNASNDVGAPETLRGMAEKHVQRRGHYSVKTLNETDQILRDQMGVTLGSQLDMTTPQQLGEKLGVDGVLYGYLVNFDDMTTGVHNEKKVRAAFRLVDAKTGKVVWSAGQGVKSTSSSGGLLGNVVSSSRNSGDNDSGSIGAIPGMGDIPRLGDWHLYSSKQESSIGGSAVSSLGGKLVGKATGTHLKAESETMLQMIFADFPIGRGSGVQTASKSVEKEIDLPETSPFFGYFMMGKKDFSSDFVIVLSTTSKKNDWTTTGKLAKGGENLRTESDWKQMEHNQKNESFSSLSHMVFLKRANEKKSYTLYPDLKKYLENSYSDSDDEDSEPDVQKTRIGEVMVDGHPSDKYEVTLTEKENVDGREENRVYHGYSWEAKDIGGFVIKTEFKDKDTTETIELKNVKLGSPAVAVFEIPSDYSKATFFDLMQGSIKK